MSERKRKAIEEEEGEYKGFHTVSTVIHDHVSLYDNNTSEDMVVHGVNKQPTVRTAEISQRAGRIITKLIAKEDNSVVADGGTIRTADKVIKMVEEETPGDVSAPSVGVPSKFEVAPHPPEEKGLLKNMIDNLQGQVNKIGDRIQSLNTHDKIIVGIACAALAFGLAAFALGLRTLATLA